MAGCASRSDAQVQRERVAAASVRTDPGPLARRWPQLGAIRAAQWVGGVLTDERVPGPNTYFVEAVVAVPPEVARRLVEEYGLVAVDAPQPPASLLPHLPGGPWLGGDVIDRVFGYSPEVGADVSVQPDSAAVYVSARGEGLG